MSKNIPWFTRIVVCTLVFAKRSLACKGGAGTPCSPLNADNAACNWVFGLILPRSTSFISVSSLKPGHWIYSPDVSCQSPLKNTLKAFTMEDAYLYYTDAAESPFGKTARKRSISSGQSAAHAKGLYYRSVAPKESIPLGGQGLQIHHSIPKFPILSECNTYQNFMREPDDCIWASTNIQRKSLVNGQHVLMMRLPELKKAERDPFSTALSVARVAVFRYYPIDVFTTIFSPAREYRNGPQPEFSQELSDGEGFVVGIGAGLNHDMAEYLAEKVLKVKLLCTSWAGIGGNDIPATDGQGMFAPTEWVSNVRLMRTPKPDQITLDRKTYEQYTWGNTVDHSKWCIADPEASNKKWVCVRSTNREFRQVKRGADARCFEDAGLHQLINDMVVVIGELDGGKPRLRKYTDDDVLPEKTLVWRKETARTRYWKTNDLLSQMNKKWMPYQRSFKPGLSTIGGGVGPFNRANAMKGRIENYYGVDLDDHCDGPRGYLCSDCDKRFVTSRNLKQHRKAHTGP